MKMNTADDKLWEIPHRKEMQFLSPNLKVIILRYLECRVVLVGGFQFYISLVFMCKVEILHCKLAIPENNND